MNLEKYYFQQLNESAQNEEMNYRINNTVDTVQAISDSSLAIQANSPMVGNIFVAQNGASVRIDRIQGNRNDKERFNPNLRKVLDKLKANHPELAKEIHDLEIDCRTSANRKERLRITYRDTNGKTSTLSVPLSEEN